MRNTRYYEKKNDGVYFSKLSKDEQCPADDGRIERHWTFGNDEGSTWGYEVKELDGLIESAFVQDNEYGIRLCICLQHPQGVDVLQVKLYKDNGQMTQDGAGIAKKLGNVELDEPICFGCYVAKDGSFKTSTGNIVTPCYITMKKPGGRYGINYKSTFEYDGEEKKYIGLPGPELRKVGPKEIKDYTERDQVLFAEIEKFCKRVEEDPNVKARKEDRDPTPSEAQQDASNELEEEVPF
jgi:hypothetical protein